MNADEAIYRQKLLHCQKCEHREKKNCGYVVEPDCDTYFAIKVLKMLDKYEKGLLIELPVPIGGKIYEVDYDKNVYERKLKKVIFDLGAVACTDEAIGTTFFATREEAEKKAVEAYERRLGKK